MTTEPTIARICRGRTRPEIADDYEAYLKTDGIPPLEKTALGVELCRDGSRTRKLVQNHILLGEALRQ